MAAPSHRPAAIPPAHFSAPPVGSVAGPPSRQTALDPVLAPAPLARGDIRAARSGLEFKLQEHMNLQQKRYRTNEVGTEERVRVQAAAIISDIRLLRQDISVIIRESEARRWRRLVASTVL